MKALGKLLGELMVWRWAPAVGLCIASLFYVLVVVALVPDEIGVPVTNARFAKKTTPATPAEEAPELPTYPAAAPEVEAAAPPPVAQIQPAGVVDFGRRGFSPPIDRPEPPPAPPPPVMAPPPVVPAPVAEVQPAPEAPVAVAAPQAEAAVNADGAPAAPPNAVPGMNPAMQALRRFPFSRGLNPSRAPPAAEPPAAAPAQPVPPTQ